jgi:ketosteroid isomerase-like protein
MSKMFPRMVVLSACAFALAIAQMPPQEGNASQVDEIKALIAKYAAVVNAEPVDINLASHVWENSSEVSFIDPLSEEHGWEAIKSNFYQKTMGAMLTDRKLTTRDIRVHAYGDAAWAEFNWHFTAKLRSSGAPVETDGRETQVYRKIDPNRWVLVHVHYSAMPANAARPKPSNAQSPK